MGIIFNSVKTYVEQIGRRRSIRHWNTLDSLECIFNGPTATIEGWIPKVGQSHPEYPSMTFDGAEVIRQSADITELRCTYVGKFYGVGPVAVGSSTHWGESSWTTAAQVTTTYTAEQQVLNGGILVQIPSTASFVTYISYSYVCRYQIQAATYKTISKNPDLIIGNAGKSKVAYQKIWKSGQSYLDSGGSGMVQSSLAFESDMIDRQVAALNNSWYEISETWGPQPVITSQVINFQSATHVTGTSYPAWKDPQQPQP